MKRSKDPLLLAGDIGGTKTVLSWFDPDHGPRQPLICKRYRNDDFASFDLIIQSFLSDYPGQSSAVILGVAGPVQNNRVEMTNLSWDIDANQISAISGGSPVTLLNDLEAIANGIPILRQDDIEIIKAGEVTEHGPIAILAPGTGLGEAYLIWDGNRYREVPSEGGHTDFAPATEQEIELLTYLMPRLGHVSYERVCSGDGIPNLYAFLKQDGGHDEPDWLRIELDSTDDQTPIIFQSAKDGLAEICVATLQLFMSILGSEAGNLVLQVMATGGVYLAGGIPTRIVDELKGEAFLEAFTRKGRLSEILHQVPVYVIINENAALYGAANYGLMTERAQKRIDR
jgi:glucokinase